MVAGNLGSALFRLGAWQEARNILERALSFCPPPERPSWAIGPLATQGSLALRDGDWRHARWCFEETLQIAVATGDCQYRESAEVGLAELEIAEEHLAPCGPVTDISVPCRMDTQ